MAKFKFELPAPQDSATTFGKIKTLLTGENDFKKFDPKVSCTFDEPSHACNIMGSQFKADLKVKNDSKNAQASTVAIEVEVPFALSLFKGKIQAAIEKNLKRIL